MEDITALKKMKALKLVLIGIAIIIYAMLIGIKQTTNAAKALQPVDTILQHDTQAQCKKEALLASPLRSLVRLPF